MTPPGRPGRPAPGAVLPGRDPTASVQDRVEALLADMSLPEKLAQLGSYWFDKRGPDEVVAPMQDTLGGQKPTFDKAGEHGLGHLTRIVGTEPIEAIGGRRRLRDAQAAVVARHRLAIPAIAHEECLTGVTALGATVYPAPLAWGATFDPDLVGKIGAAIGSDLRKLGVHQGLAPVLDVTRDYRWGRVEETIGEDPYLVGTIGSAYVRGMEDAGVVATLKHFVGYSASRAGRNHAPVSAGPREVADVLLAPFEMAIRDGGARSVMNSYSDVDGVPVAVATDLLTGVLRDEWGFTGTVVSDYWSIAFLVAAHRVAADLADAGAMALTAGLDIELPNTMAYGLLEPLVADGRLSEEVVDRSVRRVLTQKIELGLLDPEDGALTELEPEDLDLDSAANRGLALSVAEESVVLLANRAGTLPLASTVQRIALVGPSTTDPGVFLGCYSYPIHVLPRHPELGMGVTVASLAEAMAAEFPAAEIVGARGTSIRDLDTAGITAAVEVARTADVCILAVGDRAGMFGRGTSGEGCDVADLRLPGVQNELVEAVLATGTSVVLVVVSGRPYALGAYADRAAAIVQAFMPGEEGASALTGVLSGRVNPSGKLPVQIPRVPDSGPQTYLGSALTRPLNGISSLDTTPLFPFGHGLSYTTFDVADLQASGKERPAASSQAAECVRGSAVVSTEGTVTAAVTVTNTGDRAGTEVVQLYLSDLVARVARPVRQLIGYQRVPLAAGESARVTFEVHADLFAYTDERLRRVVEPGDVELQVGVSSEDLAVCRVAVVGEEREVGRDRVLRAWSTVDRPDPSTQATRRRRRHRNDGARRRPQRPK